MALQSQVIVRKEQAGKACSFLPAGNEPRSSLLDLGGGREVFDWNAAPRAHCATNLIPHYSWCGL